MPTHSPTTAPPASPPNSSTTLPSPRALLLERAIEYLAGRGVADLSLRELAAGLGTSHRMLIYHFGSRDELLVEVVRAIEERERAGLAQLLAAAGSPIDAARAFWRRLTDPALAPYERLFFEMYGQALQGRAHALPLLDGVIDAWLEPATTRGAAVATAEERTRARLGVAVVRGLLLDLLATGDAEGVDAAFEHYLALGSE